MERAKSKADALAVERITTVQTHLSKEKFDIFFLLTFAFNFPQELALAQGKHLLFAWDEFPCVRKLNRYLGFVDVIGLFRAAMQRQGDVSYLLAGSTASLGQLIRDPESPLFIQFDQYLLAPKCDVYKNNSRE